MAPDNRVRTLDDRVDQTQSEIDNLKSQMNKKFLEITCKLDAIFDNYREHQPSTASSGSNHNLGPKDCPATKNLCLKVSKFDGSSDPQDWIYQISQFFEYYDIVDEQRLKIAPFYFSGKALAWYRWLNKNTTIGSWEGFLQSLQVRFGPSELEDYQGKLAKLMQLGSVMEYQAEFESLSNKVNGLPESFLLSCFISGLKPQIQYEVSSFDPPTLTKAIAIAKIQELKLQTKNSHPKIHSSYPPLLPTPNTQPKQFKPITSGDTTIATKSPLNRLTQSGIQERRDKKLCFYCGDKYFMGHKCKVSVHVLIVPDDEQLDPEDIDSMNTPQETTDEPDPTPQISLHALSGFSVPQTLRFNCHIGKSELSLLVDGGSTHNFLQPRVVSTLRLPLVTDKQFDVMVGNGQTMKCEGFCPAVPVQIQKHVFLVDFYILPIQGADMVLGVQWLQILGPIVLDYTHFTMQFSWQGETIKLQGDKHTGPISLNQFRKIQHTGQIASLYQLTLLSSSSPKEEPAIAPPVQKLLEEFDTIFQEPHELPPHRQLDHEIHLEPNSAPVNVRPYRYPHFQKGEIERQVQQLLESGFIRNNTSPFSSPILLVKKKDGTWRFCIDYRALNNITIRDRFPIPTADELMDELGGSQIFSKLDLRAGYHQLRVHPADIQKTAFRTHQGHYEFLVMPFGLTNAPATFQATMNLLLQPFLRKFVAVFFDDILIYSSSLEQHLEHLKLVLTCLKENQFLVKRSKCAFAQTEVEYLGHVVSRQGVSMDSNKIQAMVDWPPPKNIKQLRGFLGLIGYYRRFVCNYASIAAPLTDLLKTDSFVWSNKAHTAFISLKTAMTSAPVLSLPNFSIEFIVESDASDLGVGVVLLQSEHPIAYFSKKLSLRMQKSSAYVRELYAITESVKK
ncbi:uncharacterized protein LOC133313043 [Gastrolobium bilobum]|uniref:uncharacterized protein LOC133313043 n=1 Tax=Gastrolobium bilobum TaxID=150636 RepID=UPI002AB272C7|nr:uncharacterized protein LOC133313043 [Gastrolobium bilobum]